MIKLFIIADDFTGALDSGVQFAAHGASTRVVTRLEGNLTGDVDVLVLDAETRHLPPADAYWVVRRAVLAARGVPYVYKRTDSVLRGNIGAELAAVMDGRGGDGMPFIPELPSMGCVARGGVYYVGGVPVSESPLGQDPFDPVPTSDIRRLITRQTGRPVSVRELGVNTDAPFLGIVVYDAETDGDLAGIGRELGLERLRMSAGCAGFAAVLAGMLDFKGKPTNISSVPMALFMICGSVNPVTRAQVANAVESGFTRIWMGDRAALDTPVTSRMILDANQQIERPAILPGGDEERLHILTELTTAAKMFLDRGLDATLMCVGGDTLMALMKAVNVSSLTPLCEVTRGVVLTSFDYAPPGSGQRTYYIMSKSGGFGEPDLLRQLAGQIGA
ncbi:MAG: four-carbon acid sugar kinase family protein [Fretibacterium sp.]|nr:four-carbon acid sugar kinase family protein [Fretibacterium sp.]